MTGECNVSRTMDGPVIDRADDEIEISRELIRVVRNNPSPWLNMVNHQVKIVGINRVVVYRLGKYHSDRDVFEATKVEDREAERDPTNG